MATVRSQPLRQRGGVLMRADAQEKHGVGGDGTAPQRNYTERPNGSPEKNRWEAYAGLCRAAVHPLSTIDAGTTVEEKWSPALSSAGHLPSYEND